MAKKESSRADSECFGFEFQTSAAIVLMLDNIEELSSIKIEGDYEDIQIHLSDGNYILAQAKSVQSASSDIRNVRRNLKKALTTLSKGGAEAKASQLVYITNSPNPLNDDASRYCFYGLTRKKLKDLPESSQKIIQKYLSEIDKPLDTNKFLIMVLPFETDIHDEKYKFVNYEIYRFVGKLNLRTPGLNEKLLTIWLDIINENSSKKDSGIVLYKKDIIWPVIVLVTDINYMSLPFIDEFDTSLYEEIIEHYPSVIRSCSERFDFVTKVLSDYKSYKAPKGVAMSEKSTSFVRNKWMDYREEIEIENMDAETLKGLTEIVLFSIITKRKCIDNIKKGVNL